MKRLALNKNGEITYCTAPLDKVGVGRCNHIDHQKDGESVEDFVARVSNNVVIESDSLPKEEEIIENPISLGEISEIKNKIFEIAGRDDLTVENLKDILPTLDHEQQRQIMKIGFDYSKYFAFPITIDNYEQENLKTQIYFSNMGDYGIGAKHEHINEILGEIGEIIEEKGVSYIKNNYVKGLTDEEWWRLQYSTRKASVNKTVSISAPGAEARNLFYGLSDTIIIDDCLNESSNGILDCDMPGGFCEKCAEKSGMKEILEILKRGSETGDISTVRIGGFVSTNLSEPLTQAYLNAIHGANDPKANQHKIIVATFEGYSSSPIIQEALKGKTTKERRRILKEGLKQAYIDQGIDIDEYNLDIVAKKMTSYKRGRKGLEYVEDGELCDISSVRSIGNIGNIFKKAALGSSFRNLSKGSESYENPYDAFSEFMKM